MSRAKFSTNLANRLVGRDKLSADKDGNIIFGSELIDKAETSKFATVQFNNAVAEKINDRQFRLTKSVTITSTDNVLLLANLNDEYCFIGNVSFTSSTFSETGTVSIVNLYNSTTQSDLTISLMKDITFVEVETVSDNNRYLAIKFNEVGTFLLDCIITNSSDVRQVPMNEYTFIRSISSLNNATYERIDPLPSNQYPMRNIGGQVNSINNNFYLYPGVSSNVGLGPSFGFIDLDGQSNEATTSRVYRYDPEVEKWFLMKDFPSSAYSTSVLEYKPGYNIIYGIIERGMYKDINGVRGSHIVGSFSFYIHDVLNDTYTEHKLRHNIYATAAAVVNDTLYILAGNIFPIDPDTLTATAPIVPKPFYGLLKYDLKTRTETFIADKFKDIFASNLITSTSYDQTLQCYDNSCYVPSINALFFSPSHIKNTTNSTIIYKFDIETETLTEFAKLTRQYGFNKLILNQNGDKIIIFGGIGGEFVKGPYVIYGVPQSNFVCLSTIKNDVIELDYTTGELYQKAPMPENIPGGNAAVGRFADGRVIIAGGCTSAMQSKTFIPASLATTSLTYNGNIQHTNNAFIVDFSKNEISSIPGIGSSLNVLNKNATTSKLPTKNFFNSVSIDLDNNRFYSTFENTNSAAIFNKTTLSWLDAAYPLNVKYGLPSSSTVNTGTDLKNISIYKVNSFLGSSTPRLLAIGSKVGSKKSSSDVNSTENLFYCFTSPVDEVSWTPTTADFFNDFDGYTGSLDSMFYRDGAVHFYDDTKRVIYIIGGIDSNIYSESNMGGYGVYDPVNNSFKRYTEIFNALGTKIAFKKYTKYNSAIVWTSSKSCIIFSGNNINDDKSIGTLSTEVFKLSFEDKGDTYLTPVYTKLNDIPCSFTNEGFVTAKLVSGNEIILYPRKAISNNGTNIISYNIDSDTYRIIEQSDCVSLGDLAKIGNDLYISYGTVNNYYSDELEVSPPFKLNNNTYIVNNTQKAYGRSPKYSLGSLAGINDQDIAFVATVIDADNNLHYFGGQSLNYTKIINNHVKCKLTENSDGTLTVGSWSEDLVPSNIFTAVTGAVAHLLTDNRILIVGGVYNKTSITTPDETNNQYPYHRTSITIYNPTSNSYEVKQPIYANMPDGIDVITFPLLPLVVNGTNSDEIFILGGFFYGTVSDTNQAKSTLYKLCKYTISTNTLTFVSTISTTDGNFHSGRQSAVMGDNGYIYVFGRDLGGAYLDAMCMIDSFTGQVDKSFTNNDISKEQLRLHPQLITTGRSDLQYRNIAATKMQDGTIYVLPTHDTQSRVTAIFNPYVCNKVNRSNNVWTIDTIAYDDRNLVTPILTENSYTLPTSSDRSLPRLFTLKSGRLLLVPTRTGDALNKVYDSKYGHIVYIS